MPVPFGKLSDVGRRTVVRCQSCMKGVFSVQEPPGDLAGSSAPGLAAGTLTGPLARRMLPRVDRREIAAIFAGGALGTLLRAALAEAFPHAATAWPWPTFAVNIVAAFALGYFVTRLQERLPLSSYRRPLLGTGLCGGLSTFSTMQVEILEMLDAHAGAWRPATRQRASPPATRRSTWPPRWSAGSGSISEPEGRGPAWTDERGTSGQGRR